MKTIKSLSITAAIFFTVLTHAEIVKLSKPTGRKPNQVDSEQACVKFHGNGAKKTFIALYPFTQGKVTAISAEETRNGELNITTDNIFCRVYGISASPTLSETMRKLAKLSSYKYQCGYYIASDGILSACSDPE